MVSVFFMLFCIGQSPAILLQLPCRSPRHAIPPPSSPSSHLLAAFIGLEAFQRTFGFFAATVFVIGGVFLGTGIAYNLAELSTALNPVEYEVMQLGSGELKGLGAIVDSVVSKLDLAKAIGER